MDDDTPKIKILFIANKWGSGNPGYGISEWENNLFMSLKETGLALTDIFHLDDYYIQNKKRGDGALLKKIQEFRPDAICLISYVMPGDRLDSPLWTTLSEIKNKFKIPIMIIWGDIEIPNHVKTSKALLPYISLNIATASEATVRRIGNPEKYIYLWVPKNQKIFQNLNKERNIDVSYMGSPKGNRLERINYLINNGIPVTHGGGERSEHLTTEDYADRFQRSKITISFSRQHYSHVLNARPFEAMLCGAMVLEEENFETPKLFIPFIDYVPYTDKKDLLEKTKYYLSHIREREVIAKNGQKKAQNLYSSKRFWNYVIKRTLNGKTNDTEDIFLSLDLSNLSLMPRMRSLKLKFLDTLCGTNLGFFLYKNITCALDHSPEAYKKYIIRKLSRKNTINR